MLCYQPVPACHLHSSIFPRSDTYKPSKNYHENDVRYIGTRRQSSGRRTFRISLFLTLHICWISAALCETFSKEFPVSWSSSFTFFEGSTSTPGNKVTLRIIFSPMKFLHIQQSVHRYSNSHHVYICLRHMTYRISTSYRSVSLFFSILTLMGKWA